MLTQLFERNKVQSLLCLAIKIHCRARAARRRHSRRKDSSHDRPTRLLAWPLLLEDGFERDAAGQIVATATRRAHLLIADGRIAELRFDAVPDDGRPRRDARGWLALPAFADMHIHLDKGHYGGPWRAATPFVSVAERIREEQGFLLDFLPDTRRRAEALLDLIAADGVAFARVHCNVDPVAGLATMEQVRLALDSRKHWLDYELVAFPQHGLLSGGTLKLMDQALASGFDVVGGLDPASVDGDIERSLNATLELAVKHDAPVDLHLHDRGELGAHTLERLARLSESAGLAGRVSVSHAYCLGNWNRPGWTRCARRWPPAASPSCRRRPSTCRCRRRACWQRTAFRSAWATTISTTTGRPTTAAASSSAPAVWASAMAGTMNTR